MAKMEKFLALLRPGMTVFVPGSSGEPTAALEALAADPRRCDGVRFITTFVPGINRFDLGLLGQQARFTSFFMHPSLRDAHAQGRLELIGLPYSRIPGWLAQQEIDIALAQVSATTQNGQRSLGPAVEFTPLVLGQAKCTVAVSNPMTPWLDGSVAFDSSFFDLVIDGPGPLPTYADPELSPLYRRIGEQVAGLVPNGSTLQVGLGQAPAAVLDALHQHRDLKLHSGIFFDSLLRLVDAGAMASGTPLVSGLAAGSRDFYQRLGAYPDLRLTHVGETHDPDTMAGIPAFFTINSAIEVDLEGNINAQTLNGRRISGRGGLPDYTAAGHASEKGASIIVLPSTNSTGNKSRIVKRVEEITVSGAVIDFVITEQGCARLMGLGAVERAAQIRGLASPQFIPDLS